MLRYSPSSPRFQPMQFNLSATWLPPSLWGPLLVDCVGCPRYWPLAWSKLASSEVAEGTLRARLAVIDWFYAAVRERMGGADALDVILAELQFEELQAILEGVQLELRNRSAEAGTDGSGKWHTILSFIRWVVENNARAGGMENFDRIVGRLGELERLYSQLRPPRRHWRPKRVRSLPAAVIEDLYELTDPSSPRNPFRGESIAYRNRALHLLLLHQGLRRGEACLLTADAVKDGTDPRTGEIRHWLNVVESADAALDPRANRPAIKTEQSVRQIPISAALVDAIEIYSTNFRGRQNHPFLFVSQEDRPLALNSVNSSYTTLSRALSISAKKELMDRRAVETVSPHDLRHTAAVFRLSEFMNAGYSADIAYQALRAFFGWSDSSEMPRHYARAYFQDRLNTVWNTKFDIHIETLRRLDGVAVT